MSLDSSATSGRMSLRTEDDDPEHRNGKTISVDSHSNKGWSETVQSESQRQKRKQIQLEEEYLVKQFFSLVYTLFHFASYCVLIVVLWILFPNGSCGKKELRKIRNMADCLANEKTEAM